MKYSFFAAALSLGLCAAAVADEHQQNDRTAAGDVVYTWVDNDGVTHYSRSPDGVPDGVEVEKAHLEQDGSLSIISTDSDSSTGETAQTAGNN